MKRGRAERRRHVKRKRPTVAATHAVQSPSLEVSEPRFFGWTLLAVLALAALVRLAATWNDLWLDEIWTLKLLGDVHSLVGVVTSATRTITS